MLTAKKESYTQFLRAEVGGRSVLWHTTTYRPGDFRRSPLPEEPKPDWVKIYSQQGPQQVQDVRFAVGVTFTDFKVEVHYPDGYTRFVTQKGPAPYAGAAGQRGVDRRARQVRRPPPRHDPGHRRVPGHGRRRSP